jgi:hypothetical protein
VGSESCRAIYDSMSGGHVETRSFSLKSAKKPLNVAKMIRHAPILRRSRRIAAILVLIFQGSSKIGQNSQDSLSNIWFNSGAR